VLHPDSLKTFTLFLLKKRKQTTSNFLNPEEYLNTGHQLSDHREWQGRDVFQAKVREIDKNDHTGDEKLLFLVSHHFRHH
jgi:hypothetical protein